MRVCIVRNAEVRSNAGMLRIADALAQFGGPHFFLSRNREFGSPRGVVVQKPIQLGRLVVDNSEVQLPGKTGRGYLNVFSLLLYEYFIVRWLLSHKEDYDVIHAFDLDAGIAASIVSMILKKPYVYHIADFFADSRPGLRGVVRKMVRSLEYLVISRAWGTIICTEERAEQIIGSSPKRLLVIHNSPSKTHVCDSHMAQATKFSSTEQLVIGYVGGLEDRRFIRTAIKVVSENPKVRLVLAGIGTLEDYVREVTTLHENITFRGKINYDEAIELYSNCHLMFAVYDPDVPNHRYSAPNKVYEAMMLGKPIIVAKGTGIDHLVSRQKFGLCIDYSEAGFREAVDYFLDNPAEIVKMGRRARDVYPEYSWDIMKQRIVDFYGSIDKVLGEKEKHDNH